MGFFKKIIGAAAVAGAAVGGALYVKIKKTKMKALKILMMKKSFR